MAEKHPYVSAPGYLVQVITQLRKSLPPTVNSGTLKKLGLATNNESYILNILRFLGLIDQEGNKTEISSKVLTLHDEAAFAKEFGGLVTSAYRDLFDLHGDSAWSLDQDKLISFFRSSDSTTALVGKLQTSTFKILAAFSGHGDVPEPRTAASPRPSRVAKKKVTSTLTSEEESEAALPALDPTEPRKSRPNDVGLTVRVEINLPADGSQETYDRIFKSIRENLLQ